MTFFHLSHICCTSVNIFFYSREKQTHINLFGACSNLAFVYLLTLMQIKLVFTFFFTFMQTKPCMSIFLNGPIYLFHSRTNQTSVPFSIVYQNGIFWHLIIRKRFICRKRNGTERNGTKRNNETKLLITFDHSKIYRNFFFSYG